MTLQQISLNHPAVRAKLGLPDKDDPRPRAASDSEKMGTSILTPITRPEKLRQVDDLCPKELLAVSDYDFCQMSLEVFSRLYDGFIDSFLSNSYQKDIKKGQFLY